MSVTWPLRRRSFFLALDGIVLSLTAENARTNQFTRTIEWWFPALNRHVLEEQLYESRAEAIVAAREWLWAQIKIMELRLEDLK